MRYFLHLAYDGTHYRGWQIQPGMPTVQAELDRCLTQILRRPTYCLGSGRTDTGVHATGQVIHVDLARAWPAVVVRDAINAHLRPEPISVLEAEDVSDDWHARFSATERRYLYRILDRPAPPALDKGRVWHVRKPLDAEAMHAAARTLIGHHDFTTFRDMQCQAKSPMKTLDIAIVRREGEEVHLVFASRSFLHRQVRSMVGSIAEVGIGRWSKADLKAALDAKDRTACGQVAPADGLYLTGVGYAG